MFNPQMGVSLHTLSFDIDDKLIELVQKSEVRTLELFSRLFLENSNKVKAQVRKFDENGLRIATIHSDFWGADISSADDGAREKSIQSAFFSIELAVEFGASAIVLHSSKEPIAPEERSIRKKYAADSLRIISEKAASKGKKIAVELLPRTCLGNTVEELFELTQGLSEDSVGFCLDTNHLMDKPFMLPEMAKTLGKRLIATHLSDYDGVDEKHQVPGTGVIEWGAFMAALKEIDYQGPFNFECRFADTDDIAARIAMLESSYKMLAGYL